MSALSSSIVLDGSTTPAERHKRSLLLPVFDRIVAVQHRRAEREVARVVARHGSKFTDNVERSIIRDLGGC